jgi:catechol 2,3-dioxygenase-like lactoylglutathione lyase family enzyme
MAARLLDHVGVVGTALGPLRESWRRLGFAPTEPRPLLGRDASGRDVALGQSSCHAVFDGGYVELTAVDPGMTRHHLDPWRRRGDGLWILAFGTDDAAVARGRAAAAGLPVTPVMEASRAIDYGARHGEARFRWFMLDPAQSPEALVCTVEHRTPDLVFQPEVRRHPNGARALRALMVVVPDLQAAADRYARWLGQRPLADDTGCTFGTAQDCLELRTPAAFAAHYPGTPAAPALGAGALRVGVERLATAAALLERAGVRVFRAEGRAWVGPADTGGTVVEFVD